jgi:hypothetical protein
LFEGEKVRLFLVSVGIAKVMEQQTQEEAFWHDSNIVLHTLLSDLAFIDKQLNGKDDQVWRRAYCRALFALIESGISYLKNYILAFPEGGIDEDTELRLSDKRRIKLKDGSEQIATSFMPFQDSVTFALETFAWFCGLEYQVRKEDSGWKALVTTSKTRNRIVHPKTWTDMAISDEEMISLQRARR